MFLLHLASQPDPSSFGVPFLVLQCWMHPSSSRHTGCCKLLCCSLALGLRLAHCSLCRAACFAACQYPASYFINPSCVELQLRLFGVCSLRCRALGHGLDVTLFDRVAASGVTPLLLDTQYRMHPAISAFPSEASAVWGVCHVLIWEVRVKRSLQPWEHPSSWLFFSFDASIYCTAACLYFQSV